MLKSDASDFYAWTGQSHWEIEADGALLPNLHPPAFLVAATPTPKSSEWELRR